MVAEFHGGMKEGEWMGAVRAARPTTPHRGGDDWLREFKKRGDALLATVELFK
jgi:hypothetical protein